MADPVVNFFKSTLVGTYSDTDTSLTIATGDGALLPDPSTDGAFNLTIFEGLQVTNSTSFEIVRVTARSGDVLTVTRGAESTTPLTIGSATHSILMSATKKTFDDINDAIDNVDLTSLTGVEELTFDSTGDEEFGLPAGTTAQRPASPSAGYMRWNSTDSRIEFYNGSRWAGLSEIGFQSETMEVGQLSVTANDAVAQAGPEVEYLVIAGGGGGGNPWAQGSGGGGAGGYRSSVVGENSGGGESAESVFEPTLSTSYTVTIGAGGTSGSGASLGSNGSNSVFNTITSTGGGLGGTFASDTTNQDGQNGGSGGGGGSISTTYNNTQAGSGTANQGFDGGDGIETSDRAGGGGGGASQVGETATSDNGGDGGDGVASSITGSSVTRAGGGGGGVRETGTAGNGGAGGGGNGAVAGNGSNATTNTGSGGGGGGDVNQSGGNGGSGVVILRYPSSLSITIGAGLTGTETTDGSEKYAVITAGTGNVSWT